MNSSSRSTRAPPAPARSSSTTPASARRRAARVPAASSRSPAGSSTTRGDLGDASSASPREALARGRDRRRATSPRIGITNQRETTVLWDRAHRRARSHNAIVWQDRRTAPRLRRAAAPTGSSRGSQRKTGLVLDPYFSGTKLAGCSTTSPGARARAERGELAFGTIDSLARLEADRRRRPRHRRDERVAHAAVRHPHGRLGRRAARAASTSRARCCREVVPSRGVVRRDDAGCRRRRDPDRGHRRRPAGRAVRPGLLRARAWRRTPTAPAASC